MGLRRLQRGFLIVFTLLSTAVFVLWGLNLAVGAFPDGIFQARSETSLPGFHLLAEFSMAVITMLGAAGMWRGKAWGRILFPAGVGMFLYSGINSLGWAVVNDPAQGIPMGVAVLAAAVTIPLLIRAGRGENG